jgi:hypothetical protein
MIMSCLIESFHDFVSQKNVPPALLTPLSAFLSASLALHVL